MAWSSTRVPAPSLVRLITPPKAPVELVMALPRVKVAPVAVLVSMPSVAPACKPSCSGVGHRDIAEQGVQIGAGKSGGSGGIDVEGEGGTAFHVDVGGRPARGWRCKARLPW